MVSVKQSVEWELAGETEVLGGNLPQCHFVHHKSHMTWPDVVLNQGRRDEKPVTNSLSYGMAGTDPFCTCYAPQETSAILGVTKQIFAWN
jgi:hypothetical protein